ncbi:MAG: glycosyltransferase [Oscillospiraceae bacterium]
MKLLFAHDTVLIKSNNNNLYTNGSFNKSIWDRYTSVFEDVTVISRISENILCEDNCREKLSYFPKYIKHIALPNIKKSIFSYFSLKGRKKQNQIIEDSVKECDFLISRLPSTIGVISIKYAKKHKKPYLVEMVGCPFNSYWHHSNKGKLIAPFMYLSNKNAIKNAEQAVYVTEEYLQNLYPCRGISINCSNVLLKDIDKDVVYKKTKCFTNLNLKEDIINLVTVGSVDVSYKGQEYVIKAISLLKEEGISNIKYHLIGLGRGDSLRKLAKDLKVSENVIFIGSLPNDKVIKYLEDMHIYIQPSLTEGLPRSVIEAMSMGLVCTGSNVGAMGEIIDDDYLFNKKDYLKIKDIIKNLDKKNMISESEKNFEKSKSYNKEYLDKKRYNFYKNFKERL